MNRPQHPSLSRLLLFLAVLVATLWAGLHPKDYGFKNRVRMTDDGLGLEFRRYGVAFTKPFLSGLPAGSLPKNGFTLTLVLGANSSEQDGLAFLASIYTGDDSSQFVIAQWRQFIVAMNGNDYRNRLRQPRISAKLPAPETRTRTITITSDIDGSRIFIDGKPVQERTAVILKIPSEPNAGRIVLGNSPDGTLPWKGVIRSVELHDRVLSASEIKERFDPSLANPGAGPARHTPPLLQYEMSGLADREVAESRDRGAPLAIPKRTVVVERRFLGWPFDHQFELNRSFAIDVLLNFFGLIPFGWALSFLLAQTGASNAARVFLVLVCALGVSFGIELAQTWLPSRRSSALDLLLNGAGALAGAGAHILCRRPFPWRRQGRGRAHR